MKDYFNRIPKEYRNSWVAVSELCEKVLRISKPEEERLWPILALCHKSVGSFNTISYLLSCYQFSDCLILGRSILENEIQIRWLVDEDTHNRVEEYLQSLNNTKIEFNSKLKSRASTTFQALGDFLKIAPLEIDSKRERSNIRTRSGEVGIESTYDVFYWITSKFVHADLLSIANYKSNFFETEKELSLFFEFNKGSIFDYILLTTPTLLTLHIITHTNRCLKFGLDESIQRTWNVINQEISKNTGVIFSEEIKMGTVSVRFMDGTVKEFTGRNSQNRK
jgi:hypothetical protein